MVNTQLKRMSLIELIMEVSDEELLDAIREEALQLIQRAEKKPDPFDAVKPIRENVSLEQLMEEQNYKPIDYNTFRSLAEKVELDDPIDDLLADLTA